MTEGKRISLHEPALHKSAREADKGHVRRSSYAFIAAAVCVVSVIGMTSSYFNQPKMTGPTDLMAEQWNRFTDGSKRTLKQAYYEVVGYIHPTPPDLRSPRKRFADSVQHKPDFVPKPPERPVAGIKPVYLVFNFKKLW